MSPVECKKYPMSCHLYFFLKWLCSMSHVEFKKCPCRRVEFRGQGPLYRHFRKLLWTLPAPPSFHIILFVGRILFLSFYFTLRWDPATSTTPWHKQCACSRLNHSADESAYTEAYQCVMILSRSLEENRPDDRGNYTIGAEAQNAFTPWFFFF